MEGGRGLRSEGCGQGGCEVTSAFGAESRYLKTAPWIGRSKGFTFTSGIVVLLIKWQREDEVLLGAFGEPTFMPSFCAAQ